MLSSVAANNQLLIDAPPVAVHALPVWYARRQVAPHRRVAQHQALQSGAALVLRVMHGKGAAAAHGVELHGVTGPGHRPQAHLGQGLTVLGQRPRTQGVQALALPGLGQDVASHTC